MERFGIIFMETPVRPNVNYKDVCRRRCRLPFRRRGGQHPFDGTALGRPRFDDRPAARRRTPRRGHVPLGRHSSAHPSTHSLIGSLFYSYYLSIIFFENKKDDPDGYSSLAYTWMLEEPISH